MSKSASTYHRRNLLESSAVARSGGALNKWPGGPRRVRCLGAWCEREFTSPSKSVRMCPNCRAGKLPRPEEHGDWRGW